MGVTLVESISGSVATTDGYQHDPDSVAIAAEPELTVARGTMPTMKTNELVRQCAPPFLPNLINQSARLPANFAPRRAGPRTASDKQIVLGGAALLFLGFGIAYAVPVFFPILSARLNIPAWHLTALFSVTGAAYFMLGLVSGPLAERVGAHLVTAGGLAALASGLFMMALARSEVGFDIACLLGIGVGVGLCFVPVVAAVQALCRHNPALAGGIAASGIGAGTMALPMLAHVMADELGWRSALQVLALLTICGIWPALWLAPRGVEDLREPASPMHRQGPAPPPAAGSFRLLYAAQVLISLAAFVPFAHLGLYAKAEGLSVTIGVFLVSLIGLGSIAGRVLIGFIAEKIGSCRTASLCALIMAGSFVGLVVMPLRWELGCVSVFYGIGYGGANGLLGPIVAEVLGIGGIYRSVGSIATSRALGILIGPWAIGAIECGLGCYKIPFLICAGIAGMASVMFAILHRGVADTGAIRSRIRCCYARVTRTRAASA